MNPCNPKKLCPDFPLPSCRLWNEGEEGMSDQLHVGDYKAVQESNDSWTEWLPVERGAAKQRLDMKHGFLQSIVRPPKPLASFIPVASFVHPSFLELPPFSAPSPPDVSARAPSPSPGEGRTPSG